MKCPERLEAFRDRNIFLVAATLRPETMCGQTNVFVDWNGDYGVFEMKNDELFICTERAAKNLAY